MSNGIPKSARDVLAKQTAADAHLSPDLLNAYAEHSLTDAEKQQVTLHLASCADCREVVFLASAAGVEELEPALVASPAPRSLRPAVAAAVPQARQQPEGCAVLQPRPKPPTIWWKWALPLTAVVVVGAAVLVERDRLITTSAPPAREVASVKRAPAQQTAAPVPASPAASSGSPALPVSEASRQAEHDALTRPATSSKARPQAANRLDAAGQAQTRKPVNEPLAVPAQLASKIESAHSNALVAGAVAPPPATAGAASADAAKAARAAPPASTSQSVEVTSAAPLVQADNAELSQGQASDLKTQAMAKSLTADQLGSLTTLEMERNPAPVKTRWRISSDGHVEHTVGPSTWARVMAAEPVTFRVVATVGNNVWAGGSDAALFHSSDGGQHWTRVPLSGGQGTITSIHFNTAQQGSVSSDSGATWVTSDGGRTWSKQ